MKHALLVAVAVALLVGCKSTVKQADMEKNLRERLAQMGIPEATIQCPDDLSAKQGSVGVCKVTVDGATYELEVTVTSIEGDKAMTDTKWKGVEMIDVRKLEGGVAPLLSEDFGVPVTLACGAALRPIDAKREMTCDLTAAAHTTKITFAFDTALEPTVSRLEPPLVNTQKMIAFVTADVRAKTKPTVEIKCAEVVVPRPADGVVSCTLVDGGADVAKLAVSFDEQVKITTWETKPL